MSRPLTRLMSLVHGQPDWMATPRRASLAVLHCTGGCLGGRQPCDCVTGMTELSCEVAPDAARIIAPPPPLSDDARARIKRHALYWIALGFAVLAGLLKISETKFTP